MKALFGRKLGMTQVFDEEGRVVPVTVLELSPNTVTQLRSQEKDGYGAVQVGVEQKKHAGKSEKGRAFRILGEFRTQEFPQVGDTIDVSVFAPGDQVRVSGVSKGKGFQGAVKRHGFSGRNATHGVKHEHRTLGSVGSQQPQRVVKGKKMPGQTGRQRVTLRKAKVVKVDAENHMLALKGQVPGARGTIISIQAV